MIEVSYENIYSLESPSVNIEGLEALLNGSFGERGLKLVDGYFEQLKELQKFLYLVQAKISNANDNTNGELAGILIATKEIIERFEFVYYDKIAVAPKYQGNGIMKSLLHNARAHDSNENLPSILRTSDKAVSEKYSKGSGITVEVNSYYVHGFGFCDKDSASLFENAVQKFNKTAEYVAGKPATVI